jgi:GT2 family glycosyltransferase
MADNTTVFFGIPFGARGVYANWDQAVFQLNATITSIYAQLDPHFKIIVACTDRPELSITIDERTEFLYCEQIALLTYSGLNSDAGRKRYRIAQRIRELGGGYLMFADADDLISAALVSFVRYNNHPHGYVVGQGYALDAVTGLVAPYPFPSAPISFDQVCGTSAIVRFEPDDLPGQGTSRSGLYEKAMIPGHRHVRAEMLRCGRPLLEMPFPAVTFVRNTGENLSVRRHPTEATPYYDFHARLILDIPKHAVPRTLSLDREFGLPGAIARTGAEQRELVQGPSLSVLVATYKRPAGLKRLLSALAPQVRGQPDREVIIVNDGSHGPEYESVLSQYGAFVTYDAAQQNAGVGATRQRAASQAKNEYIVFIDDDCEPPVWWLDWLSTRLIAAPDLDVVAGTTRPLWNGKRKFVERVQAHYGFLPHPWAADGMSIFVTANVAIRRKIFNQVGGIAVMEKSLTAGEDTELSARLSRSDARGATDNTWYVFHEVTNNLWDLARRYWRYGYANVWIAHLPSVPSIMTEFAHARRRGIPRHAKDIAAQMTRRSPGFSRSRVATALSICLATIIQVSHFVGCAAAARQRRREGTLSFWKFMNRTTRRRA